MGISDLEKVGNTDIWDVGCVVGVVDGFILGFVVGVPVGYKVGGSQSGFIG